MQVVELTKEESSEYMKYLYSHVSELTGYDSELSRHCRDIIYGKYKDSSLVSRYIKNMVITTNAFKPKEYIRDFKIERIINEL